MAETFRAGVGLVVVNEHGHVFAVERAEERDAWQLPQGGIEPGESPEDAAWRELKEELALGRNDVDLVAVSQSWTTYELPRKFRNPKVGRGQVQQWFLFRLGAGGPPPDVTKSKGELKSGRFTTLDDLIGETISFRRSVYREVLLELGAHLYGSRAVPLADPALLVADFEHLAESYWRNEEMGERRLQFLVGLVTASAAGIGFLGKREGGAFVWDDVRLLALGSAAMLLFFGVMTLLRMARRNRVTDGYLTGMKLIRRALLPTQVASGIQTCFPRKGRQSRSWLNGGLAIHTALINAGLAGVVVGAAADQLEAPLSAAMLGIASAGISFALQLWWLPKLEESS